MLRASLLIAGFLLLGRLAGFMREIILSAQVGASETADAAIVLLTLPDLLVNLLLGGGLTAALVPAFKRLSPTQSAALVCQAALPMGAGFVCLALLIGYFSEDVLHALAPGLSLVRLSVFGDDLRLVAWAIPLTAMSGLVVAYLNANNRFSAGASGTLTFNLAIIGAILLAPSEHLVTAIAIGALSGALFRLGIQIADARHLWIKPDFSHWHVDRALTGQFLGAFSYVTILVLLPPVARAFSSWGNEGDLALFNYAHKLIELPLGVLLGPIAIVLLPRLAADIQSRGKNVASSDAAQANLAAGIRATLLVSLGVAIPAALYSDAIVRTVFFAALFSDQQWQMLGHLAAIGFLSLPVQGLLPIFGAAFASDRNMKPLILASSFMFVVLLVVSPIAGRTFGVAGVMAVYAGVFGLGAAYLAWHSYKRFGRGMIQRVLQRWQKSFLLPSLIALAVAGLGKLLVSGVWQQMAWAALTCIAYATALAILDQSIREIVTTRAAKVFDRFYPGNR